MILDEDKQGVWCSRLDTYIRLFVYDFESKVAEFYLPVRAGLDGQDAIEMAMDIDESVKRVNIYSDYKLDVSFTGNNGIWTLIDHHYNKEQENNTEIEKRERVIIFC